MNIVIIEDEKISAQDLAKKLLSLEPTANIVATIASVEQGINYFASHSNIDVIFSDIQLGDGLSFEIYEQVQIDVPIIFCTAFNEYALQAFNTAGIDYILKPFSTATVQKALQKFKTIVQKKNNESDNLIAAITKIKEQMQPGKLPNILIQQAEKITPLSGEKIALFYIEHGNVKALLFDGKIAIVNYKLEDLEKKFIPVFFRVNRQFLIHRNAVKEASHHFNRKLLLHLTLPFNEEILVGKEKYATFLEWLENN